MPEHPRLELAVERRKRNHAPSSESGGTYFIAYGPMIVGVIRIFRGLAA